MPPERIVDYLALIGDSVDNVPGVDKVGPKTACKWIEQYGSLEGVLAHADEISGVVGENLRKCATGCRRRASCSRLNAMSDYGHLDRSALRRPANPAAARELYERFGFKTWLRELEGSPAAPAPPQRQLECRRARRMPARYGADAGRAEGPAG